MPGTNRRPSLPWLAGVCIGTLACTATQDATVGDASVVLDDGARDTGSSAALTPGTCGVSRRSSFHGTEEAGFSWRILRVPGGFAAGAWDEPIPPTFVSFLILDHGTAQPAFTVNIADAWLHVIPIGADALTGRLLLIGKRGVAYEAAIISQALDSSGVAGTVHDIGNAFIRGTSQTTATASLDGLRGMFVTGHVLTDAPHAFLLDVDGNRVGDVANLTPAQEASTAFDCQLAIPTVHAAAVSLVDTSSGARVWRFIELSAYGSVIQQLAWTGEGGNSFVGCPRVQLIRSGFSAIFETGDHGILIYTIRNGALMQAVPRLGLDELGTAPLWVGESTSGMLLLLVRQAAGSLRMARVVQDGSWSWIPGDLPVADSVVPAEGGKLFVAARSSVPSEPDELYEIECSGPDLEF
jgi:hypothetical protein